MPWICIPGGMLISLLYECQAQWHIAGVLLCGHQKWGEEDEQSQNRLNSIEVHDDGSLPDGGHEIHECHRHYYNANWTASSSVTRSLLGISFTSLHPPFSEPSVCSGDLLLLVAIQEWSSKGIFKGTFQDISIVVMGPRYSYRGLTVWLRDWQSACLYVFRWRVSIASTQFKWWSFSGLLWWFGGFMYCDWSLFVTEGISIWCSGFVCEGETNCKSQMGHKKRRRSKWDQGLIKHNYFLCRDI